MKFGKQLSDSLVISNVADESSEFNLLAPSPPMLGEGGFPAD